MVKYADNQKPAQAVLKWNGELKKAIPRGFSNLRIPDDVQIVMLEWTTCVVIFDKNLEFAQFPLKAVNKDGTIDLGPALPFKIPKEDHA